jgi:hypothetical protein
MRTILSILLVNLFFVLPSNAQHNPDPIYSTYEINKDFDRYFSHKYASGEFRNILTEEDIEGSPYLNDEFIKGSIFTTTKTQFVDVPLRYNIYNDQIEFTDSAGEVMAMTANEMIEKVVFGGYTMEFAPYLYALKEKSGFFEVLVKGKATLYARPEVLFQAEVAPAAFKDAEPAKFIRKDDSYYIRIGVKAAEEINSKKELITVFPENQNKMEAFIKKNKISIKDRDDLKKTVEYYNSL